MASLTQRQRQYPYTLGHVRTGLEDTFYLPDGSRAQNNGELISQLVKTVTEVGREVTTAEETKLIYKMVICGC